MKTSLDHLPETKQRELERVVAILHEEFEDALVLGTTEWKKQGRILKIILFGSYARGDWVDEPHTTKGYRSDFDLLIIVNNKKLEEYETYWHKAKDRLVRDRGVKTPVSFIVHSRRFVNEALRKGQYFFTDIRKEGIALYELDDEDLAEAKPLTPRDAYDMAKEHLDERLSFARTFMKSFRLHRDENDLRHASFILHQAIEHAYSTLLLVLTSYSPPSHNVTFLRALAEGQDRRLVDAWPRDTQRYRAWFNTLGEAYVKARYSKHYVISEEALEWLGQRTEALHGLVETVCKERLTGLARQAGIG